MCVVLHTLGLLIDFGRRPWRPSSPDWRPARATVTRWCSGRQASTRATARCSSTSSPRSAGWGAWQGSDGEGSLINNVNGAMKDFPVEILETKAPLRVRRHDPADSGRRRGGAAATA